MNAQFTRNFLKRTQSDPRFAHLKMLSREGNLLVVTGEIDTHDSYDAFIELGRLCGFIVLCDELTINEPHDSPTRSRAASALNGVSKRDAHAIFHLLPPPPEEDDLGGYEYHCGECITAFFNETGHRHIQRHGAWGHTCGSELILIWQAGDPL